MIDAAGNRASSKSQPEDSEGAHALPLWVRACAAPSSVRRPFHRVAGPEEAAQLMHPQPLPSGQRG